MNLDAMLEEFKQVLAEIPGVIEEFKNLAIANPHIEQIRVSCDLGQLDIYILLDGNETEEEYLSVYGGQIYEKFLHARFLVHAASRKNNRHLFMGGEEIYTRRPS